MAIPASEAPDASALELRAEWEALRSEILAADAKCHALSEASGGLTDDVAAAELLAEATYWFLYYEPAGLWAPQAESQLADDPPHVISGVIEEAVPC